MSALYMDGFAHYGSFTGGAGSGITAMLGGPWAEVTNTGGTQIFSLIPAPFGSPAGSWCIGRAASGFQCTTRRVLSGAQTKQFMSFRYAVSALPIVDTSKVSICDWRDGSNNILYTLRCTTTGAVELWSGAFSSLIATSEGPLIVAENFHFFETCYDPSTTTMTIRVDDAQGTGTPAISTSVGSTSVSQNGFLTAYTTIDSLGMTHYLTDLYVRNGAGSINNSWLGDQRIATLFANADTTTAGWTPSYYHQFGAGILTLGHKAVGTTGVINPTAYVGTAGVSSLDIGSADFTLETMVRFDALPASGQYSTIFSRWDAAANKRSYRLILGDQSYNNGCLQLDTSTDGTSSTLATPIQYPWVPVVNTWYHIALVRAAGELLLFVNGQQFGLPIADSSTYFSGSNQTFAVGLEVTGTGSGSGNVANTGFFGRMDETRFTNGVGRYTGPFTPPAAAFPRSSSDPDWSQVVLLMGYDSAVLDESSFARTVAAKNGAFFFTPTDGPAIGAYSTVNKATPDDNTFISAFLVNATNILTMTTQPSNTQTVTVGTTDGTTDAVYTFKTVLSTAFDVLIDTSAQNTLTNLLNAINAGPGSGTKYGTDTTSNFDVLATQLPVGQIEVSATTAGTVGNSIASTSTATAATWATTTLTGGADIPGPTNFRFQRPPPNTTTISAMQTIARALKTDAGTASIQTTLVGPLGGTDPGTAHAITVSPVYYADIIETDPDTSGPLTPTTIINGQYQINRTA